MKPKPHPREGMEHTHTFFKRRVRYQLPRLPGLPRQTYSHEVLAHHPNGLRAAVCAFWRENPSLEPLNPNADTLKS